MDNKETQEVTTTSGTTPTQVVKTTQKTVPAVTAEHPQATYGKKKVIFRAYQIIWYIVGLIEILLLFRVTLKGLGANPYSGFTSLVYSLSDPLAQPFSGIFGVTVTQKSVFEWSTFIAGIVYALLAYGLVHLLQLIKPTTPEEVEQNVDNQ